MLNERVGMETMVEGEATTAAARWWDAVNADQMEEAMAIASTIVVPPLSNSFSFDEDEEGIESGGGGSWTGSSK